MTYKIIKYKNGREKGYLDFHSTGKFVRLSHTENVEFKELLDNRHKIEVIKRK